MKRQDAARLGLTKYFTGVPCKNGHVCERRVADAKCVECNRERAAAHRSKHPGEQIEYLREWRKKNKDHSKQYREANAEKIKRQKAEWVANNYDDVTAYAKEYYAANRDMRSETAKRWRDVNPERHVQNVLDWQKANPDRVKAHQHKRRSLKVNAAGAFSAEDIMSLFDAQDGKCNNPYCRTELTESNKELDHIVPISKGGSNFPSNLQWLCGSCNASKKDKDWDVFLSWYGKIRCCA